VDDILIVAENESASADFKRNMERRFGGITFHNQGVLKYLGMRIAVGEKGISLDMIEYLDRVLDDFGDVGDSKAPGTSDAMMDDISEPLREEERLKFHATVAKLLYLVKKTRTDGLLMVSKLAGRVTCANEGDMRKLMKLIGYFRNTRNYGIMLAWNSLFKVEFYVDASYNCEPLGKSRTGIVMTMDGQALSCWTSKQKLVARSSTEAEIIGLSEGLTHALWIRNLLGDIGLGHECISIYQDNRSAIHITKNGRNSGQRTKHLDVKLFHAIDCYKNGDIDVVYIPTEKMLADYFTKPLVGASFYELRENLVTELEFKTP
jgi:ribonuclease HI